MVSGLQCFIVLHFAVVHTAQLHSCYNLLTSVMNVIYIVTPLLCRHTHSCPDYRYFDVRTCQYRAFQCQHESTGQVPLRKFSLPCPLPWALFVLVSSGSLELVAVRSCRTARPPILLCHFNACIFHMLNIPLTFRSMVPMSTTDSQSKPSSTNNPFRNRPVSPNPAGESSRSSISSSGSDGPEEPTAISHRQQASSPQSPSSRNNNTPSISVDTTAATSSDLLSQELPPAYTPAPDVYSGEQSVEFGPRRPFQRAPPPATRPQQTGPWQSPQATGWTGHSGQMYSQPMGPPHINSRPGLVPPPTHPLSTSRDTRAVSMPPMMPTPNVTSDFARDFYTAGAPADMSVLGGSSEQYTAQNGYAPTSPGSGSQYNPPPDVPPRPSGTSSHSRSQSESSSARAGSSSTSNGVPDDGSPTKTPTPGHPLLNRGNILVYPKGYDCGKCELRSALSFLVRSQPYPPRSQHWLQTLRSYPSL